MANEYRVTTIAAEVLRSSSGTADAVVTTFAAEVLRSTVDGPSSARIDTIGAEVLRSITSANRRMSLM